VRRYAALKPSRGTTIPGDMRRRVLDRDYHANRSSAGCVLQFRVVHTCAGARELDHVRASHGTGMKSVTCDCNLVSLCSVAHRIKTEHGKDVRPVLLDYLDTFGYGEHTPDHLTGTDHGHVELVEGCDYCRQIRARLAV